MGYDGSGTPSPLTPTYLPLF